MKMVLIVSFADFTDHQDIAISIFESIKEAFDAYIMLINSHKSPIEENNRVRFVKCPLRPGITKGTFNVVDFHKVVSWIRGKKFDLILFESLHIWNVFIMAIVRKPIYYQMVFDVIPHEGEKATGAVAIMNKVVGRMADKIILTNQKYVDAMCELYNTPKRKVVVAPMIRRFSDYLEPKYTKKFLFFGRINPYKGANNLFEIAKLRPDFSFEVYGPVSAQEEEIVKKLKSLKNVNVYPGYIFGEKVQKAFEECDWVILPYNSATISGVVLDAYRYSRPVVGFDVGALSEQIVQDKTGYLVEKDNLKAFCEKLDEVNSFTENELEKLSKNAYETGLKLYGIKNAGKRYVEILEEQ